MAAATRRAGCVSSAGQPDARPAGPAVAAEPAVSVILPFRNARRFLPAALESIATQDFRDIEIIAIDDGSDDDSAAIVRAAAAPDPRVRLIDSGRRGLPEALNEGCRLARGRYLARMDADDIALPSRLARQVAALDASPDLVVVGGAVDLIDEQDRTVGEIWYAGSDAAARSVLAKGGTPFCHPAATIRRSAFDAAGGYRAQCQLAEDLDLWLRLAGTGTLLNVDAKVLQYRLHPASASYDRIRIQIASRYRALLLNDTGRPDDERRRALDVSDAWTLIHSWASPGSAANHLAASTSWYVEGAVTAGYDDTVGALIRTIAGLAPSSEDQASIAWVLWQGATVAAIAAGRHHAAAAHLARGEALLREAGLIDEERSALESLTALTRSNLKCEVTTTPPPQARDGGYLDVVQWLDGGRRALLTGWIARPSSATESSLRLHAGGSPATATVRRVLRPDVAQAMGGGYLASGFLADLRFDEPPSTEDAAVQASVSYDDGRVARLEDANVLVQRPES